MRRGEADEEAAGGKEGATGSRVDCDARAAFALIAHDLRNPLAAVRMTAQLLNRPGAMEEPRRAELAQRILSSTARMERLISGLVEYVRASSGAPLILSRAPTALADVLRDAKASLGAAAGQVELPAADVVSAWDRERLTELFAALFAHALRVRTAPAPVVVQVDAAAPAVHVRVGYDGSGDGNDPSQLFEPFTQVDLPPGSGHAGPRTAGLDLFVARIIARAHDGDVWADERVDRETPPAGSPAAHRSCLVVRLPLTPS